MIDFFFPFWADATRYEYENQDVDYLDELEDCICNLILKEGKTEDYAIAIRLRFVRPKKRGVDGRTKRQRLIDFAAWPTRKSGADKFEYGKKKLFQTIKNGNHFQRHVRCTTLNRRFHGSLRIRIMVLNNWSRESLRQRATTTGKSMVSQ